MKEYYLYHYEYTNTKNIHIETAVDRILGNNNYLKITNEFYNHMDPIYKGPYHLVRYHMDYMLTNSDLDDTFTFNNNSFWDLYDKQMTKHKSAITKRRNKSLQLIKEQNNFDLINNLNIEALKFKHESFKVSNKTKTHGKNKYIYFLKSNEKIVYVGQTQSTYDNRTNRPNQHTNKEFDSFDMIQIENYMDLDIVEAFYIIKYKPKYNKSLPTCKEWSKVIKFALNTTWDPYNKKYL